MKRAIPVLVLLLAFCAAVLWAGWHNYQRRIREHAALMARLGTQVQLIPGAADQPSATTADGMPDLVNHSAPDFTLDAYNGPAVTLSSLRGRPVVLNFWAVWCAPCKVEMPWFARARQQYSAQGLEVLGVATDAPTPDEVLQTSARTGANYPLLHGTRDVDHAYGGVDFLPETFYIGRNGQIVTETSGLGDESEIQSNIQKILATH